MPINDRQIRKFLLGSSSEIENEEIGVRLISDEKFGDRFDQAESELVEDHLDGLLSNEEEHLFRGYFLVTPERRRLLAELRLLHAASFGPSKPPADLKPLTRPFK